MCKFAHLNWWLWGVCRVYSQSWGLGEDVVNSDILWRASSLSAVHGNSPRPLPSWSVTNQTGRSPHCGMVHYRKSSRAGLDVDGYSRPQRPWADWDRLTVGGFLGVYVPTFRELEICGKDHNIIIAGAIKWIQDPFLAGNYDTLAPQPGA